ncbi:THUMP domain-containing class I SAM-dependent RNA methyltransferase [Thermobrachium celere]|uniref:FIG001721: Predicted N6-adenine-specific DNA methylase n=1 Tax=Thermobrachium celere DSM 8682 TaxID=941824 RepID=R7RT29_9CLOT|nr:class I SAM-dependent RNA methyltransferase [Thermobrachium celere]CDF59367.1 FIG001721: Predicted N6-adenine-specific DNA methylase [Thermobrachium celere DSM 8682]
MYDIVVTTAFGIESVTASELKTLGYSDYKVENGKITLKGNDKDVAKLNMYLRTADRVYIKLNEFRAETFEDLFQGTLSINFPDFLPRNAKMHVIGKSVKSKLFSVSDCQAIVKKAVVEAMKRKYKTDWFSEDGSTYKIEVALLKDIATISLDTSGIGLHKRGYRTMAGEAPLKETLAAAMVLLSKWTPDRQLIDPFCGSGTILIEAALIGKNIAPGLNRSFDAENWAHIDKKIWNQIREKAKSEVNDLEFKLLGQDIDGKVLKVARENIKRAGVENLVFVQKLPMEELSSKKKYGCIICNPPYGERIGEIKQVEKLYKRMGEVFSKLDTWSYFILTNHLDFEKLFGKKADKNRKLYNGKLLCYLYQYFGPLPPKKKHEVQND